MSKRGTGVAFIAIAALLFSSKYLSAAIFGSSISGWNKDIFHDLLSYVGSPLSVGSIISLIMGIAYIAWGEYEEYTMKKQ